MTPMRRAATYVFQCMWVFTYALLVRTFNVLKRMEAKPKAKTALAAAMVAMLAVGIMTGCKGDPKKEAEKHYAKGMEALKSSKQNEAIVELRRSIQLNPQHSKAHFELGKLYFGTGNIRGGYQELMLALKSDPKNKDANMLVAEMLLRFRAFDQALAKVDEIQKDFPQERSLNLIKVEALLGQQKFEESRKLLEQVLQQDPANPRALYDQSIFQLKDGKFADAEASLRRVWDMQPNSMVPPATLSAEYMKRGDNAKAEAILKEAVQRRPDSVIPKNMLYGFYMQNKRFGEAEALAKAIQSGTPKDSPSRLAVAEFYLTTNNQKEAEAELKRLTAQNKKDYFAWQKLVELYVAQNRVAEAKAVLSETLKENPNEPGMLDLSGRLKIAEGNFNDALLDLQKAQKFNPDNPQVYVDLSKAYLGRGEMEQSKTSLEEALKREPGLATARVDLANLQIRSNQVDEAIKNLQMVIDARPSNITPYVLMSAALTAKGEFQQAESNLARLVDATGDPASKANVYRAMAAVKFVQKKFPECIQLTTKSLELDARPPETLQIAGSCYLAMKQPAKAVEVVNKYVAKNPSLPAGQEVLGGVAFEAADMKTAQAAYEKALQINPKLLVARRGLAEVYLTQNQPDKATGVLKGLESEYPRDYIIPLRLAQISEQKQDWDSAKKFYERSIELNDKNPIAKNNLAYIYAEKGGNLDMALKLAQEAREAFPADPRIGDTLAWIYIKKGSYESAVQFLKDATAKMPQNATYKYHLGLAYSKLGKNTEAKQQLQAALKMPNFAEAEEAKKVLASLQ
ncbi:MAG TPA: tetratricopeptide repeat protein [Terriglobales bacterium]|nr:tetratricopeptide repeat protein [Terriglobales bacterium]